MRPLVRALAATAISVGFAALPLTCHAQSLVRRDQAAGITANLPPVDDVPWLATNAKAKRPVPRFDPSTITAVLLTPTPAPSWPGPLRKAAGLSAPVGL